MKRFLLLTISVVLVIAMLTACGGNNQKNQPLSKDDTVKTGLAVISTAEKSTDAGAKEGLAQADSTVVAVTVDKDGKIVKCVIDGIQTKVNFNAQGKLVTPLDTKVKTKNELGTEYGMKKASGIGKEWNEQAAALANYVQGKTVEQVKGIAVNEKGAPTAAELSSSVTVSIGGYVAAIEKAVANAKEMGAKADNKLGIGAVTNISKSKDAGEADGLAQAYSSYAAVTFGSDGKITSCIIDGSQTNVNFSKTGKITSDIKATVKTKNELGTEYGMKKASSIGKEWNEQAAALAKYVVGKTSAEVKGIAVNDKGAPSGAELKSSVTVSIGDYVAAIEKAAATAK